MYDVIIIGAGPAGLTAALYASRAKLNVLVLEKAAPGGKVFTTDEVENYPGIEKIKGRELALKLKETCLQFGAKYEYGDVVEVNDEEDKVHVKTNMGEYYAKKIIIATGMVNRKLNIPGEDEYYGKGVSYCAICDGNFFKGKEVVIVGGGNSALEESLYLAEICSKVTLIHRRDTFRAEKYIVDNVVAKDNIEIVYNSVIDKIKGEEIVEEIDIRNTKTNEIKTIKTSAVFIYVGFMPQTEFLNNLDILDNNNCIDVDKNMQTKYKNIYAAGDVINKELRQIITAQNDGAIAAQHIIKSLES